MSSLSNKLILGTVQMGLNYGINNEIGQTSIEESHQILLTAYKFGITTLDTAEAYGSAHRVIGQFHRNNPKIKYKIITKVPGDFDECSFRVKVDGYLNDLEVDFLEVLMFHSFDSFKNNIPALDSILKLKSAGLVKHIGVSAYTNEQLEYLLDKDYVTVVQLPFNLLDNYSLRGALLEELKLKGKIIHTRSVFLQGLFFKKATDKHVIVKKLQFELDILNQMVSQYSCSIEELALSYCLQCKNIDNVVIGVDSVDHLNTNLKASSYMIDEEIIEKINKIKVNDVDFLNPSLWQAIRSL